MSQQFLDKLEKYEQSAYDGGFGADWLEKVGESLKFYVQNCVANGTRATMSGLEAYIDSIAPESAEGEMS